MGLTKEGLSSAFELAWASDKTKECCEQFSSKGIVLYNSATHKIIDRSVETRAIVIPKKIWNFDGINYCKVSFKLNELDHYYDYAQIEESNGTLTIEAGSDTETYSIGKTVKLTKDTSGNPIPINGCKYIIANLQPTAQNVLDFSKLKVYELNDIQIRSIMMNNTLSQAIEVPHTKPENLVCLYDFPEQPHDNLFIFQPKYLRALKCFETLEKAGYRVWHSSKNKLATQKDMHLTNIDCDWKCIKSRGDSYVDWCKNALKTVGFHHFYEFNPVNPSPLKIRGGAETDTYSIGIAEQRIGGITKVEGCKYVLAGFNQTMEHVIDLSNLKVKYGDLFFHQIYMNNTQSVAAHIGKTQPNYVFCILDYNGILVAENFIFAQNAKPQESEL